MGGRAVGNAHKMCEAFTTRPGKRGAMQRTRGNLKSWCAGVGTSPQYVPQLLRPIQYLTPSSSFPKPAIEISWS